MHNVLYTDANTKTTDWRYLTTPVKERRRNLGAQRVERIQKKTNVSMKQVNKIVESNSSTVHDPHVHDHLLDITEQYDASV